MKGDESSSDKGLAMFWLVFSMCLKAFKQFYEFSIKGDFPQTHISVIKI